MTEKREYLGSTYLTLHDVESECRILVPLAIIETVREEHGGHIYGINKDGTAAMSDECCIISLRTSSTELRVLEGLEQIVALLEEGPATVR